MSFVITRVPADCIDRLRSMLLPRVKIALYHAHNELNAEDVLNFVQNNRMQLWVIQAERTAEVRGVAVTEVVEYPQLKAVRVVTLSGVGLPDWSRKLDDALTAFAKAENATRLEAFGRKGLIRMLSDLGFAPAYTALIKEVV